MQDRKRYFLIGIGGSGMMPLAMILNGRGAIVAGSDRSLDQGRVAAKFNDLRARGVALFAQDGSGITSSDQIVVASAAIERDVADMVRAEAIGCERMSRAALLASLFNASDMPIGVAGTSGKSTVTGMIGWILHATGRAPTVMNGAVMKNFVSDEQPFASALVGNGPAFVSEVDESDGSISLYRPQIAVLNNVSLDHKELGELRVLFGDFIAGARTTIVNIDNADAAAIAENVPRERVITISIRKEAGLYATDIVERPFATDFMLNDGQTRVPVSLRVPGRHNVANAVAAIGAARAAGISITDAAAAIAAFAGLRRRFDRVGEADGVTVIDDFGHNPDKIAATLDTLHAFPGRLLILFQPHGFGPLKVMRAELTAMFRERMRGDDVLILSDPVYQGGTTLREVTSADIVAGITPSGRDARHVADRANAAEALLGLARRGDRIVVMGARDDTLSQLAETILAALTSRDVTQNN